MTGTRTMTSARDIDLVEAVMELGDGPLRFAPKVSERPIATQIASLGKAERACFDRLKSKWEEAHPESPFTDEMYLRFARSSRGKPFNSKSAFKAMKSFSPRYLTLNVADLETQLATKTLFPVPDLKTKDGHDVFYMKPSRFFPKETSTRTVIDNLTYCMNCMCEQEQASREGIGFVANMNDWNMKNFSVEYCAQFMMMLQGKTPARVVMFLIVNPPGWFDKIWKIMKPMLLPEFRKKVRMIPEDDLGKHLSGDYKKYLPDEFRDGRVSTRDMVNDFIEFRKYVENLEVDHLKV